MFANVELRPIFSNETNVAHVKITVSYWIDGEKMTTWMKVWDSM